MESYEPADISIYIKNKGIVLKEPSLVAVETVSNKILAYGTEAGHMAQYPSDTVKVFSPLRRGRIAEYSAAVPLFSHLLLTARGKKSLFKPFIALCMPGESTEVERKAFEDLLFQIGAKEAFLSAVPIEELLQQISTQSLSKLWQKVEIFICITKNEPERYVTEQLVELLTYAKQEGISAERISELFQNAQGQQGGL